MAPLAPLGQPFGSPSQIINIPGPLEKFPGSQQAGRAIGAGFARFLENRKQQGLEDADRAALAELGGLPPGQLNDEQTARGFANIIGGFKSDKFKGIADQIFAQRLARQADPTGQQQREATIDLTQAQAEKARRVTPISPSQQLSQKKIDAIDILQKKADAGTISPAEKALLDKAVLGGKGDINIDFSKGQLLTAATSLRKESNTDQRVKDFRILAPKFKNMLSFLNRSKQTGQKGPTDIALSKTFQKLTDLMSSVREGEYETTFRGQSLLQKLRGGIQRLKQGGEGITPEFRQELVDTARLMFEDGKLFFNQAIEEKATVADAFGIPRQQILGNIKPFSIVNTEKEFADIFGTEGGDILQQPAQPQGRATGQGRTPDQEARFQELLRKRGQ